MIFIENTEHVSVTYYHTRNFANNTGRRGDRPWLLGTLIYERVKLGRGGR